MFFTFKNIVFSKIPYIFERKKYFIDIVALMSARQAYLRIFIKKRCKNRCFFYLPS